MARILLVDDNAELRAMLGKALRQHGHEVIDVSDGKHVLPHLKDCPTDLVITDIVMPDRDGIETLTELRRLYPTLPVIAMSGGGIVQAADYLALASLLGARRTFEKPMQIADLLAAVREVLGE